MMSEQRQKTGHIRPKANSKMIRPSSLKTLLGRLNKSKISSLDLCHLSRPFGTTITDANVKNRQQDTNDVVREFFIDDNDLSSKKLQDENTRPYKRNTRFF